MSVNNENFPSFIHFLLFFSASGNNHGYKPYFMRSHTTTNNSDNIDNINVNDFSTNDNSVRTEHMNSDDYAPLYYNEKRKFQNNKRFP